MKIPEPQTGRPVRLTSLSFCEKEFAAVASLIEDEAAVGTDLILLPETFLGERMETLSGSVVRTLSSLAKRFYTWIVSPLYLDRDGKRFNSTIVFDRNGTIAAVYDKVYPYWDEFNLKPVTQAGKHAMTYPADFGKIGLATCFDVNFPQLWDALAGQGAELVVWSSAYSAGSSLQAHALNHHYSIVTATLAKDCLVYDITGECIHASQDNDMNITRLTLDLDRAIYHQNFNLEKRDRLLQDYDGKIVQEKWLENEQWFVLKSVSPGIRARETARRYGLEELRDYLRRSSREIDQMRGSLP